MNRKWALLILLPLVSCRLTAVWQSIDTTFQSLLTGYRDIHLTTNFPLTFDAVPQVAFGIASISLNGMQLWMNFTVSTSSLVAVSYTAGLYTSGSLTRLTFSVLLNSEPLIEVGTVRPLEYPSLVPYSKTQDGINWAAPTPAGVNSFVLSSITNWNQNTCMNASGIRFSSASCDVGHGSVTYVLLQEVYLATRFAGSLPLLSNYMSLLFQYFPSSTYMLFASVPLVSLSGWSADSEHEVQVGSHTYLNYHCVEDGVVGFSTSKCQFLLINPQHRCRDGLYMAYKAIGGLPEPVCATCHWSCLSCTYNPSNPLRSTEADCTSCYPGQSLMATDSILRGKCLCDDGRTPSDTSPCQSCKENCLKFSIQAIPTSAGIVIRILFSQPVTLTKPLADNIVISLNNKTTLDYVLGVGTQDSVYWANFSSTSPILEECSLSCLITVAIPTRTAVLWRTEFLQNRDDSVVLKDVTWNASNTLQTLTRITESFITLAYAANAANYVKVLFEIEQLIEYHKYLNLTLPANFLQLLVDMTNFEYVNVFGVTNIDVYGVVATIFTDDFDNLGDVKAIQYARGINFLKNMTECLGSFASILLSNLLLWGLVALVPCGIFQSYRKHLAGRKLNTFNDNFECVVMPIAFFSTQQLTYVFYQPKHVGIYLCLTLLWVFVAVYPFILMSFIYHNRRDPELEFNYEDLMMDCNLDQPWTYILYVSVYFRRLLMACFLAPLIPGELQLLLCLLLNTIIVIEIVVVIHNKYYGSKIKIGLKMFFNLILVCINLALMIGRKDFVVGEFCKIAAYATVFPGLFESLLKIGQAIYNVVQLNRDAGKESLVFIPQASQDSRGHSEQEKQEQRKGTHANGLNDSKNELKFSLSGPFEMNEEGKSDSLEVMELN